MPFYKSIDQNTTEGRRIVEKLLELRKELDDKIPSRTLDSTLLLATWNIREFDSPAYGTRVEESFYYIAEIVARFDIIAIQEIRKDLSALEKLNKILGSHWKYIVTDITAGTEGNKERMAFLYDSRKVKFGGLASELTIPPIREKDENKKTVYRPVRQFARTPFVCGFRSGWTKFMLGTVHVIYGKGVANDERRVEEIQHIAKSLRERSEDETAWSHNLILLGDFNIFAPKDLTMKAITDEGFCIPEELQKLPSNIKQNRYYDQIAFRVKEKRFGTTGRAGVFNFFDVVFKEEDEDLYVDYMGDSYYHNSKKEERSEKGRSSYYKTYWRTHQMSDHLPMWVELKIDFSDEYLERKLEGTIPSFEEPTTRGMKKKDLQ